jgi:hypothetical protein
MENDEIVYKERDYGECRLWSKDSAAMPHCVVF